MTGARILHVDDEPDIREVVRISLGLDPELTVRSCASGAEALSAAGGWQPDLVLLDVMMPDMDGPTTLSELYKDPRTAGVLVVFMTARAQARELDYFKSLGATGVIAKPFDPIGLAAAVREFLRPAPDLDAVREEFPERATKDANELLSCIKEMSSEQSRASALARVRKLAHGLAGAGGLFGYSQISEEAAALEDAVIAGRTDAEIKATAATLLARIFSTVGKQPKAPSVGFSNPPTLTPH